MNIGVWMPQNSNYIENLKVKLEVWENFFNFFLEPQTPAQSKRMVEIALIKSVVPMLL